MAYKKNPKFLNQIQYCERERIPIMVVIGEEEKARGEVKIRDVQTQKEASTHTCSTCMFCCRGLPVWPILANNHVQYLTLISLSPLQ